MPFPLYSTPGRGYCEVFEPNGSPRPHWRKFIETVNGMGNTEVAKRIFQAEKMLQKHGATYNLFGDPEDLDRPWELDLVPFIIPFSEWRILEAGLIQRARLLDALMKDIYGEQRLLRQGKLPPEFVFANPCFLRPCSGIGVSDASSLFFFAVDLCRTSDGQWRVIGNKTQIPKGPGFALENRVIMSNVMARIFHQNCVMRVAPFFINLQEYLRGISFYNRDDPGIVLLSSGPAGETYFEQAFLSRYLGYPMVESGDLTVRDGKVYVKTLGGLEPVDIIFRWIADGDCDPLALRGSRDMGVSGLIHAARTGNVVVVNPIGAGVIESPVFSSRLPALCRDILGEKLLLKDLAVLWCGDPDSLEQIKADPGRHIIRSCFNNLDSPAVDGGALSETDRNELMQNIGFAPYEYVAQEKVELSTIPTLTRDGLKTRKMICRFYISATREGFQVMPGGLARVSDDGDALIQSGGDQSISKDIWVLSEGPVEPISLMGRMDRIMEIQRGGDLPSRVADNLLWLGRYLERAENCIRIQRSILKRLSGEVPFRQMPELPVLLKMAADREMVSLEKMTPKNDLNLFETQEEILESIFDDNRPTSLISTLKQVHRTATSVRDRLSPDSWRILSRLEQMLKKSESVQWIQISETFDLMSEMLIILSGFSGLAMESMTRGLGWRFMDMGRRIARANGIIHMVKSAVVGPVDDIIAMLDALLETADSSMTYRYRYRTYLQVPPAMDLLLADELNPRSLAFQLAALSEHMDTLPRNGMRKYSSPEERTLLSILTTVRLMDVHAVCEPDNDGYRQKLNDFLKGIETGVLDFSDRITQHYLSRIPTTQHFTSLKI